MAHYIALLRKEPDTVYGVDFPDFPGCVSAGENLEEARRNAAEALKLHLAGLLEDGEAIPEPLTLDAVMADPANTDAVAFLVGLDQEPTKSVRVNITLPESELIRIDQAARRQGLSRSAFLLRAAQGSMWA
ncbi:MAG: type II toxin-antitoxin system HicB family antitoxin [Pseudomonadota bacterium]